MPRHQAPAGDLALTSWRALQAADQGSARPTSRRRGRSRSAASTSLSRPSAGPRSTGASDLVRRATRENTRTFEGGSRSPCRRTRPGSPGPDPAPRPSGSDDRSSSSRGAPTSRSSASRSGSTRSIRSPSAPTSAWSAATTRPASSTCSPGTTPRRAARTLGRESGPVHPGPGGPVRAGDPGAARRGRRVDPEDPADRVTGTGLVRGRGQLRPWTRTTRHAGAPESGDPGPARRLLPPSSPQENQNHSSME